MTNETMTPGEIIKEMRGDLALYGGWGSYCIGTERRRQIEKKGWGQEHDDEHDCRELGEAATDYLLYYMGMGQPGSEDEDGGSSHRWPFEKESWKPSDDPIANLTKAGALIAAEIDRLERAKP